MCYAFLILTPMIEVRCSLPLILSFGTLYISHGMYSRRHWYHRAAREKLSHAVFIQVGIPPKFSLPLNI